MSADDLHKWGKTERGPRSVYFRTFGCQMNVHDSERMRGLLSRDGITAVDSPHDADIIIINTCSVREKPEEKTYSEIGRYRRLKEKKEGLVIGVTGCVAQQKGEEIVRRFPYVDLVLGTKNVGAISNIISEIVSGKKPIVKTEFHDNNCIEPFEPFPRDPDNYTAFVTVIQGCNNFCSYCIVPYVRGREMSRPSTDITDEIKSLIDTGIVEITLLGQNVNSYSDPKNGLRFPELIRKISKIDGIYRIRFVTSHPKDMSDDLISCFKEIETLSSHIHLPVQSGSNKIIKMMNRGYTVEDYIDKIERLRSVRSDLAVTTDIIVGFPGEDVSDFEGTLSVMEKVEFDNAFSFKYSERPGTAAARLEDDVSPNEKSRRLEVVQDLQKRLTMKSNLKNIDSIYDVLATGLSIKDPEEITGRSDQNKIVNFKGTESAIGSVVPVKIKKAFNNSLWGEVIQP
ncbi:MAG: tRNA (N6-isopentenyl adenosine(37)-C2)-methylthiotransferase MiaB [Deltaproteobacteria bacterium]|uniref:tRNA-2-methylthio-N(6)-dimethylallyladenosine synthase n=1 Tax=Candidatus Zymogenus saltonus TaxID=2844893 RepID=A0A9D8PPY4_9DELT|nr:tRNA (N6-isopentenyl adenosine(37)-C2)-methylthiotransferase MiaB [Candidatus Zymogenus saltonus]